MPRNTTFWAGSLLLASCGAMEPRVDVRPATLNHYGEVAEVSVPASASEARSFSVSVATLGGGCTREIERTDVSIINDLVEIRPYNRTTVEGGVCTADIRYLTHTADLELDPGQFLLRFVGKAEPGGTEVTIERTIIINPL